MAKAEVALEQHPVTRDQWNESGILSQHSAQVSYNSSARLLRTPEVQDVVDRMLPVVLREAGSDPQIEVYSTAASDEMQAHLVISVKTDLPAAEAFVLWDRVGDAVQKWSAALPKSQEDIARDIAVEVLWDVDHAAA